MKLIKLISEIKKVPAANYIVTEFAMTFINDDYDDVRLSEGEDFADYVTMLRWTVEKYNDQIIKQINYNLIKSMYEENWEAFDDKSFIVVADNLIKHWLEFGLIEKA